MSVVKMNAMQVIPGEADDFMRRFGRRPGRIERMDGFEGFQVLRPDDGRDIWLVVTRWRDDEAFNAWEATRPQRDPATITYARGWELWSYALEDDVAPEH